VTAAENTGATPAVKLAELDSARHHLESQVKRDRAAQAERNRRFHEQIDRIETQTNGNAQAVAGIVATLRTFKWIMGLVAALGPTSVGAAFAIGRLLH
jgi:heme oxygenase